MPFPCSGSSSAFPALPSPSSFKSPSTSPWEPLDLTGLRHNGWHMTSSSQGPLAMLPWGTCPWPSGLTSPQ